MTSSERLEKATELQDKILAKKKHTAKDIIVAGDITRFVAIEMQMMLLINMSSSLPQLERNQDMLLQCILDKYNRDESKEHSKRSMLE